MGWRVDGESRPLGEGASVRVVHVCSGHSADDGRVFHRSCVSLAREGYDVHLIAQANAPSPYREHGVTIHPLFRPRTRSERLARRRRVAQAAANLEPDLLHVHEPELLGPVIARAGSRPVIWDVHESYLDVLVERSWIPRWLRPAVAAAWHRTERRLVGRCAAVVVATERIAHRYRQMHERVHVVANYPITTEIQNAAPADRDGKTCVFTGTVGPNRGLSQTFKALAILNGRGVGIPLALAGKCSDGYQDHLRTESRRLGIGQLVTYHGILSMSEALQLQREASIGLVPHLPCGNNLAAWPIKMMEFMAAGLPVVYSAFPSHEDIAGVSRAGIAVDPTKPEEIADAIERLVKDPELASRLGENGRRAARRRFNWDTQRPRLLELYRRVLRRGGAERNGRL